MVDRIEDIKDPICRAKLEAIQGSTRAIDVDVLQAMKALDEKRGLVGAADLIAKRLFQECGPVQKAVKDDKMDSDEAKVRIEVIQSNVHIVNTIVEDARKDVITQQGVIQGLHRAAKINEDRFKNEATKYERWERIQAEDAEEAAEAEAGGENVPEADEAAASGGNGSIPKAVPKQAAKHAEKPHKSKDA